MIALERLRKLLDIDIETEHDAEQLTANRKLVTSNVRTALEIATKADENRLRQQSNTNDEKILNELLTFDKTRPAPVTIDVEASRS